MRQRQGLKAAAIPSRVSDPPTTNPRRHERWRRVAAAREYVNAQALTVAKALVERATHGDTKAACWLLEHTAVIDHDGREVRPIATSIDRQTIIPPVDNGPRVVIGVSLGRDFDLSTAHNASRTLPPVDPVD